MSRAVAESPWYRHFWPWFVVGLLGVSIAGSLATVVVAFNLGDLELSSLEAERAAAGMPARSAGSGSR
jgi:uncharacterized membrane protein YadS